MTSDGPGTGVEPRRPATSAPTAESPSVVFGRRVRALRRERGWTVKALASASGVNKTFIGQIERGERNPTLLTLLRLGRGFGVDAGVLITGMRVVTDNPIAPVEGSERP